MHILRNLTILFFSIAFIACTTKKQDQKAKDFFVSEYSIKADTVVNSAVIPSSLMRCYFLQSAVKRK